jgi:hypothetical protein
MIVKHSNGYVKAFVSTPKDKPDFVDEAYWKITTCHDDDWQYHLDFFAREKEVKDGK